MGFRHYAWSHTRIFNRAIHAGLLGDLSMTVHKAAPVLRVSSKPQRRVISDSNRPPYSGASGNCTSFRSRRRSVCISLSFFDPVRSELDLKILARLRAHEIVIQHLLWLALGKDANALRDYAARQDAHLDTGRLPDLDPARSVRLPYETQEALAKVLQEIVRHAEDRSEERGEFDRSPADD